MRSGFVELYRLHWIKEKSPNENFFYSDVNGYFLNKINFSNTIFKLLQNCSNQLFINCRMKR